MPIDFQVTVDCDDPHAQARFWAETLDYELEVDSAFVREMVAAGRAREEDTVEIDGEVFWRVGAAIRHPDAVGDLEAARRAGNRVLFLAVPDRAPGKNRWHLDLHVGPDRREDEVERLVALGARVHARVEEHGQAHVTLADPEDNLFCVQ